ncbi:MAG: hypothetical protein GC151_12825 [Betaproteobacteria bacterium]|nr:hypothetical protein [Betaproteobacteria bacterium]
MTSSTRTASPRGSLDIELRASPRLTALLVTAHVLAASVPWLLGFPAPAAVACSVVLLSWGTYQTMLHGLLRARASLQRLEIARDGRATLHHAGGQVRHAWLSAVEMSSEHLVVLRFRVVDGGRGPLIVPLCPDACGPDGFRRLRAGVRWGYLDPGSGEEVVPSAAGAA